MANPPHLFRIDRRLDRAGAAHPALVRRRRRQVRFQPQIVLCQGTLRRWIFGRPRYGRTFLQ